MNGKTIVAILLASLVLLSVSGCGEPSREDLARGNVIATADSKEKAKEIAKLYDMELISWGGHVALYHSDRDIAELQRLGEENGWPPVDENGTVMAMNG